VVLGVQCTLIEKVTSINITYYPEESVIRTMQRLVLYAMLRYFLGFLLYGRFDIRVLLQVNTATFFDNLSKSRYKDFTEAFQDILIRGFDKYFKYNMSRC